MSISEISKQIHLNIEQQDRHKLSEFELKRALEIQAAATYGVQPGTQPESSGLPPEEISTTETITETQEFDESSEPQNNSQELGQDTSLDRDSLAAKLENAIGQLEDDSAATQTVTANPVENNAQLEEESQFDETRQFNGSPQIESDPQFEASAELQTPAEVASQFTATQQAEDSESFGTDQLQSAPGNPGSTFAGELTEEQIKAKAAAYAAVAEQSLASVTTPDQSTVSSFTDSQLDQSSIAAALQSVNSEPEVAELRSESPASGSSGLATESFEATSMDESVVSPSSEAAQEPVEQENNEPEPEGVAALLARMQSQGQLDGYQLPTDEDDNLPRGARHGDSGRPNANTGTRRRISSLHRKTKMMPRFRNT